MLIKRAPWRLHDVTTMTYTRALWLTREYCHFYQPSENFKRIDTFFYQTTNHNYKLWYTALNKLNRIEKSAKSLRKCHRSTRVFTGFRILIKPGPCKRVRKHQNVFQKCYILNQYNTIASIYNNTRLILGLRPANERRRYKVTTSLIGWAQT